MKLQSGHSLQLLEGSREYFPALVRAIDGAEVCVRLETYIFDPHGSAQTVVDALARAASRGVEVRVLMDALGTRDMTPAWQRLWRDSGVQWLLYKPTSALGMLEPGRWRRLHRKLCVVDGSVGFCGGINILDDDYDPGWGILTHPRLDFAVAVAGPLVHHIQQSMDLVWWRAMAIREWRAKAFKAALGSIKALQQVRSSGVGAGHGDDPVSATQFRLHAVGPADAALVLRDNMRHRRQIEKAYLQAIAGARHEIILANPYFLPGQKIRRALRHAVQRGVRVRLLMQGLHDHPALHLASFPIYGQLLQAGVDIYEYQKSFLHGKVAVIDAQLDTAWATVGSSNLDPLSMLLAREANLVVRGRSFATQLRERLERALHTGAQPLDARKYVARGWGRRLGGWVAYAIIRLMLAVTGMRY